MYQRPLFILHAFGVSAIHRCRCRCRLRFAAGALILGILLLCVNAGVFAQDPPGWVSDELVVGLRPGISRGNAEALYHRQNAILLDEIPQVNAHLIRVPPQALEAVQRALSRRPEIEFAEKNRRFSPDRIPDDPYYPNQWHLPKISSPPAWDAAQGTGVVIAVLDSGVEAAHDDLAEKLVEGYNFFDGNTDTSDVYGHGTKVAGTAAAASNNGTGVSSVAWGAKIMPIRVTDTRGYGYSWTISQGLTWAVDNGARVMNLSFGGIAGSSAIINAAQYAVNNGGVVVAAAGNCGCLEPYADTPYIVSVAATDANDNAAYFSSYGDYVDISAPGVGIYTTAPGGTYSGASGTSFSSPVTAGVVALVMSANPHLAPMEVMDLLTATADDRGDPGYDIYFGYGRVNAQEAVLAAVGDPPPPDTTPPGVAIASPADGAILSGTVSVEVAATDDVAVSKVELYLDGILLTVDTVAPFSFAWDTTQSADGIHTLRAAAYDAAGNSGYSAEIQVTFDNSVTDTTAPDVSIVSPAPASTVSGTVAVSVSASDDGEVERVALYLDGALLATDTAAPFSFTWDTTQTANGVHILQAVAHDRSGNSGYSAETTVTVRNTASDTTDPEVTIEFPADGSSVSKVIKVTVRAVDDQQVDQITLYADDEAFRSAACGQGACELQFSWNTKRAGKGWHTLYAVARDTAGNSASSSPVTLYVK